MITTNFNINDLVGEVLLMKIKREQVTELIENEYGGNMSRFSRELSLDPSHLHRCLNNGVGGGKKVVGAIMKYCKENGKSFDEYLDFN